MKKIIAMILTLTLGFILVACVAEDTNDSEENISVSTVITINDTSESTIVPEKEVETHTLKSDENTEPESEQASESNSIHSGSYDIADENGASQSNQVENSKPSHNETTAPTEHVCEYTSKVISPTCTSQGYTEYTCPVCGKSYKDNWTAALGHNMVEVSRDAPQTAFDEDYFDDDGWFATITYKCTRCGYTETKKELMRTWDSFDADLIKQYIINYAVNTYGYTYDSSLNLNNGSYNPPNCVCGLDENMVATYGYEGVDTTVKTRAFYDDLTVEEEIAKITGGGRCNVYLEHDGPNWEIYFLYG